MDKILKDLELFGGIHHSFILKGDEKQASTFPDILEENMVGACRVINQIFMAVEGMGGDHKEINIELEENLLIGYHVADETILVLLTDKDVNLALINTSARSALPKIAKKVLSPQASEPPVVQTQAGGNAAKAARPQAEAELRALMDQLQEGLAEFIGPAAGIVFDEAYEQWKAQHGVYRNKIAELIKVLAVEIDDKADRSRYLQSAVNTVRSFSSR